MDSELTPSIIFENEDVVVVDKPSGLLSHANGVDDEFSVTDWMCDTVPEVGSVGNSIVMDNGTVIRRDGLVHRLDKWTSGVMIFAKNTPSFESLKEQFKNGTVQKEYCGFVYGAVRDTRGIITAPIGRHKKDGRLRATRSITGNTREARTDYVVDIQTPDVSFVYFYPHTGRTHQIRVHSKHIRHPIVADDKYAPTMPKLLGFERLALHARRVTFTLPYASLVPFECISVFPEDFRNAYGILREKQVSVAD